VGRWSTFKGNVQVAEKGSKAIFNPLFALGRTYLSRNDEEQKEKWRRAIFNNSKIF
jgi:hypothetical protein